MLKKSSFLYIFAALFGLASFGYSLAKLTGLRAVDVLSVFVVVIILLLVVIYIASSRMMRWNRPNKRVLRNSADKANAVVEFFQPQVPLPDQEKWAEFQQLYPEIPQPEITELKDYLFRVHTTSENLAAQYYAGSLNAKEFRRALSAEFPELDSKSLRELYAFGLYVMK